MQEIPEIHASCAVLYSSICSQLQPALVQTAVELKLFDALARPVTSKALASELSLHQANTEFLLNGLVSCDLLAKEGGLYRNTPLADAFLTSGSPTYLGDFLVGASEVMLHLADDLPNLVKNGPQASPGGHQLGAQDIWAGFVDQMTRYALSGNAQQVTRIISRLPEFPGFGRMLDLGGCGGGYAMAFVAAHPTLKAVLFDQPSVVDAAGPLIGRYGYENRIETRGGDFVSGSIGSGYDFIWASASLNFCRDQLDSVLGKVHQALEPGGVFACLQEGLTHEQTQPGSIVLPMLPRALAGDGLIFFRQGEIAEALLQAGFRTVRSRTIHTTDGPMDIDIARK